MKITKQKFEQTLKTGTYEAKLVNIIDLGTQKNIKFNTEKRQIMLAFAVRDNKDEVRTVSKRYTLSGSTRSVLYRDIKTWIGDFDELDFTSLLGKSALLVLEIGEYVNIQAILPTDKEVDFNLELLYFDLSNPNYEELLVILQKLPMFIQTMILSSPEGIEIFKNFKVGDTDDKELPF